MSDEESQSRGDSSESEYTQPAEKKLILLETPTPSQEDVASSTELPPSEGYPVYGPEEEGAYEERLEAEDTQYVTPEEYEEQAAEEPAWQGPLTSADIAECKEAFTLFDKNADGCIDSGELLDVLHSLSRTPSDKQVQRMMYEVTRKQDSGDRGIDFEEFIGMIGRIVEERDTEEKIREAFQIFDKEGTGRISAVALRQALTGLCEQMTDEEVDQMIQERDLDEQGTLDIEHLVKQLCEVRLSDPHEECEMTPRDSTEVSEICN